MLISLPRRAVALRAKWAPQKGLSPFAQNGQNGRKPKTRKIGSRCNPQREGVPREPSVWSLRRSGRDAQGGVEKVGRGQLRAKVPGLLAVRHLRCTSRAARVLWGFWVSFLVPFPSNRVGIMRIFLFVRSCSKATTTSLEVAHNKVALCYALLGQI